MEEERLCRVVRGGGTYEGKQQLSYPTGISAQSAGSSGLCFEVADAGAFGDGPYDLIWFFDSLHDLGDPVAGATRARQQLADQSTVAVVEPLACDEPAANLAGNPGAGLQYTPPTFLCVPHSLSEPGPAALGAQAGGRLLAETLRTDGLTHTVPATGSVDQ